MGMLLASATFVPNILWITPFVALLLAIAVLPLIHRTAHWWEHNSNKLLVALVLAVLTLGYYGLRGIGIPVHHEGDATPTSAPAHAPASAAVNGPDAEHGAHAPDGAPAADAVPAVETHAGGAPHVVQRSEPGLSTIIAVLNHAVIADYIPFMVLLFSLYVIAGGIVVRGDIQATPTINTAILATGGLLASFVGTTGAAMLLIRFLLKTNSERKRVAHTVIFFIFVVANIGGSLLPIGDPPLFLGYLRGVPFLWTLHLWGPWLMALAILLVVYFVWDTWAYRHEAPRAIAEDVTHIEPMNVAGLINIIWLLGVVAAVALLVPGKMFPGTTWVIPPYLREGVQLAMAGLSWVTTKLALRKENKFNFVAIGEVACLFIGIFITMQVPIEILKIKGPELGLSQPWQFFWATGILSSFLDNAPTYIVYFETASSLPEHGMQMAHLVDGSEIAFPLLLAISVGAVFMGANTYIGNGPNFMVKAIAEQSGVKMPSFFGYMLYSGAILIPLFVVLTFVFFRNPGAAA